MRIPRIFIDSKPAIGEPLACSAEQAHYLGRVLRLKSGDQVSIFCNDDHDYMAHIEALDKKSGRLFVEDAKPNNCNPSGKLQLAQSISKGQRMDYTLQKATELGVDHIFLLHTERSQVHLDDKRLGNRMSHWEEVIISACAQSGRSRIPVLETPVSLADFMSRWQADTCYCLLSPGAKQHFRDLQNKSSRYCLITGPEGGFSPNEEEQLKEMNVTELGMGPRILRTETAGPAALAILQYRFGDY